MQQFTVGFNTIDQCANMYILKQTFIERYQSFLTNVLPNHQPRELIKLVKKRSQGYRRRVKTDKVIPS